ncbi:MAG: fumarylacetoacetate hydrolase family protein, partial [Akkermansia sp.]|nr:fumarylacetoacetate hydrolase family protein [Akkermansia sp.]
LHRASEAEARRAILGYTLMCDYSERSYQLEHGGQWTKGKSYDTFAPFGPILVTKDEIHDPDHLQLQLKVNGEVRQSASTSELIMPVAALVAYVSQYITLNPGDVVSTGTPGGVGMGMTPPRYLKLGDLVEFSCDAIGTVSQTVEQE